MKSLNSKIKKSPSSLNDNSIHSTAKWVPEMNLEDDIYILAGDYSAKVTLEFLQKRSTEYGQLSPANCIEKAVESYVGRWREWKPEVLNSKSVIADLEVIQRVKY